MWYMINKVTFNLYWPNSYIDLLGASLLEKVDWWKSCAKSQWKLLPRRKLHRENL